jgi:hypothetical protein
MPVLIEDCEIPLFARDKLFADFRDDFDTGLRVVLESVAKFTNPHLARNSGPEWHTDWSLEWGEYNGRVAMTLTFVEQVNNQPYTCLTMIDIYANDVAHKNFARIAQKLGESQGRKYIMDSIKDFVDASDDIRPILVDEKRYQRDFVIRGREQGEENFMRVVARRMGEDTGRDVLINTSNLLRSAHDHMDQLTVKTYSESSN